MIMACDDNEQQEKIEGTINVNVVKNTKNDEEEEERLDDDMLCIATSSILLL